MIQKNKVLTWTVSIIVGLGGLAVVGMAAQFWISTEVARQLESIDVPDEVVTLGTDVAVIKSDIQNINANVAQSLEAQQRFEEIFLEYLQEQAQ